MIPGQVANAQEFTDEICSQLILMTYSYIVDFYQICRMDSKSIATLVDSKIKKMLRQIIEGIFLKGDDRPDLLVDIVRPYVMNGLGLNRN
ncbi:hypothetical protein [Paenibacillus riograndensis]|uniref:hypothetical protein n=1 Tax=Paenibacillus riograndensis TaxID=483937 RepID=UPI000AB74A62|nr:hypothetical protein [Paenibacillus riograndensis]